MTTKPATPPRFPSSPRALVANPARLRPPGSGAAWAAMTVGLLYASVSVYWAVGGMWLVDTVGGSLEQQARAGSASITFAVWGAAALKLVSAVLPSLALRRPPRHAWNRKLRLVAWAEAAILTAYGLLLTATGVLVQSGVIHSSASADHRALAWHAYLWDPWFLVWGVLVALALMRSRQRPDPTPAARRAAALAA